ncbi:MAG: hypothetical protein ACLTMP_04130 [Eggerthella lenta]
MPIPDPRANGKKETCIALHGASPATRRTSSPIKTSVHHLLLHLGRWQKTGHPEKAESRLRSSPSPA